MHDKPYDEVDRVFQVRRLDTATAIALEDAYKRELATATSGGKPAVPRRSEPAVLDLEDTNPKHRFT